MFSFHLTLQVTRRIRRGKKKLNSNNSEQQTLKEDREEEQGANRHATNSIESTDFFNNCLKFPQNKPRNRSLGDLSQIRGPAGSVRGHKDVVRKSLDVIKRAFNGSAKKTPTPAVSPVGSSYQKNLIIGCKSSNLHQIVELCADYLERIQAEEHNRCVAYTTSLGIVRKTYEASKLMRSILQLNLIKFEERDIYLSQEFRRQLQFRSESFDLPALFVDGRHFGGVAELERLNESGELKQLLARFKMTSASTTICKCCGNAKFIACTNCNGSRKSAIHHFEYNTIALRCVKCEKDKGLVRCPACCIEENDENDDSQPTTSPSVDEANRSNVNLIDENNNNKVEENDDCCCWSLRSSKNNLSASLHPTDQISTC